MPSFTKAAILGLLAAANAQIFIYGDTNRDGVVDLQGDSDLDGRGDWRHDRGALFLPVITDTDGRCSKLIQTDAPASEEDKRIEILDLCHDSTGRELYDSKKLASVRTRPIPMGQLSDSMTAEDLRKGLELGIDGRDVRRPEFSGWDGRVKIKFEVTDNGKSLSDLVELRVAPVVIHHVLQKPERLYVATLEGMTDQKEFVEQIQAHGYAFGVKEETYTFKPDTDLWTQDFFETGFAGIPDVGGKQKSVRIMIKSARTDRAIGRKVFTELRSSTVGAVQLRATCNANIESLGNLETIPPHTHKGRHYPAGRVIMGSEGDKRPVMLDFMEAQEVQDPLELQTGWLATGHVDEFLVTVPKKGKDGGFFLLVADAVAGLNLLKAARVDDEAGKTPIFSRQPRSYDMFNLKYNPTLDEVLALKDIEAMAEWANDHINENIQYLIDQVGIQERDIIRVPDVFHLPLTEDQLPELINPNAKTNTKKDHTRLRIKKNSAAACAAAKQQNSQNSPKLRGNKDWKLISLFPAAINGIVFDNGKFLAPQSWGPKDFQTAITKAFGAADQTIAYMDDLLDHHTWGGEVHCGTNMARQITPWWAVQAPSAPATTTTST